MKRLFNLLKGFFSLFVSNIEQDHPELVYDNAIEAQKATFLKLRATAARVIRNATELETKYKAKLTLQNQITSQLTAAAKMPADQVDMEAATFLTSKLDDLTQELTEMKQEWDQAEKDEVDVREALLEVQKNLAKLESEKNTQVAKFHSANSRIAIREELDGISVNAEIQALDGVRNNIKNRVSEASLAQDLASNSLESKLKKFTQTTSAASAKERFLKMQQAAQQGSLAKSL